MKTKLWAKKAVTLLALIILIFAVATLLPVEHEHDEVTVCAVCCIINSVNELLFEAFATFFVFLPLILFFFVSISAKKYKIHLLTLITLKVKLSD